MSLGQIHYSEEALKSIIKTEAFTNHPVNSVSISLSQENKEMYIFNLDVSLNTFENILESTKKLQKSIGDTLSMMTDLTNIKINITIKNVKMEK